MTFSALGLIDGITGSLVVILGISFGGFFFYQSKKKNIKLLGTLGLVTIFAGLLYLGVLVDFLFVLFTRSNFPNEYRQIALLSYIWFAPVMIAAIYMTTEVLNFKRKKLLIDIYILLGIVFNILIFIDPINSFYSGFYETQSERLWDYNIQITSVAGIFLALMLIPLIFFLGIGILRDAFKTTGALRSRFILISTGAFCYGIFGLLEGFIQPGISVIIVRIGFLSSFWFMYYGLKPIKG